MRRHAPELYRSAKVRASRLILFALICFLLSQTACNSGAALVERPSGSGLSGYRDDLNAPIIFVGRVIDNQPRAKKSRFSKWDKSLPVLGWRTAIQIESVLRGRIDAGGAEIFYFKYDMSGLRQVGNWVLESRNLFFLERDSGVLRTICDGWSTCVIPVLTWNS